VTVSAVIDDLRAMKQEVEKDAQRGNLPMDPKLIQAEIDQLLHALSGIKDKGYTIAYLVPVQPNLSMDSDFAEAVNKNPLIERVYAQGEGRVSKELMQKLVKEGGKVLATNQGKRDLVHANDQIYSGLVASEQVNTNDISSKLIPIYMKGESLDPILAKYLMALEAAMAVLLAHEVKDKNQLAQTLLKPEELLNKYQILVPSFSNQIIHGTPNGLEISVVAVRAYLEWKASQQIQAAA